MSVDLSSTTVTRAARIMLPAYPVLCLWLAASYALTPRSRLTESPPLAVLDGLAPMPVWGVLFLGIALTQVAALGMGRRWLYQAALAVMVGLMGFLGLVYVAALFEGMVSTSAAAWPIFVAVACWASLLSINSRET